MALPVEIVNGTIHFIQQSDSSTVDLVHATWAIAIATIIGIAITTWFTSRSLKESRTTNRLLTLELKAKFKASFDFRDRQIVNISENSLGFVCRLWNVGSVSVRNISIYHAEYPILITLDDLIKNESKIKDTIFEKIDSTLEPEHYHGISFPISMDPINNLRIVIWLEYEYLHGKEESIAFLDHYSIAQTGYAWFDNDHIQNRKKELGI